ncbi:MAG TPA: hypothetical protein DEA08_30290 [Planctomycetes bacterium]|nr:hypothetical protein [Planctomycetota bacterium]
MASMSAYERAEKLSELSSIGEQAIGRDEAVARIEELLEDEELEVRQAAVRSAMSYPERPDLWTKVLEIGRGEPGPLRTSALEALGCVVREGDLAGAGEPDYAPEHELGEPSGELFADVRALLLERVADPASPEEKRAATLALSALSHEEAVVSSIAALLESEELVDRICGLRCAGLSGDGRWEAAIGEALSEGEPAQVLAAIEAAGRSERAVTAPLLARILKGTRQPEEQRLAAAEALERLGGKLAGPTLLEAAEAEDDGPVREAAREALNGLTLLGAEGEGDANDE